MLIGVFVVVLALSVQDPLGEKLKNRHLWDYSKYKHVRHLACS